MNPSIEHESISWQKLGNLFRCDNIHPKLLSHAANPLLIKMSGSVYRVYFSARDSKNRSSVGAVDIDLSSMLIVKEHQEPLFVHGLGDCFYSHGVSIGCAYKVEGRTYILFMGWKIDPGMHWVGEIGRLIVEDDFSLRLDSEQPFMGLDEEDPVSLSYPWVTFSRGRYQMW